jgi:hypothetical protein
MAKTKSDYYAAAKPKPLRSRGYTNLAILSLIAIGVGCALMGYEVWGEYGDIKAKPPVKVKIDPLAPPDRTPAPAPQPVPGPIVPPPGGL